MVPLGRLEPEFYSRASRRLGLRPSPPADALRELAFQNGDASAALVSAEAGSAYQWGVVGESPPVALPRIAAAEAAAL